MRTISKTRSLQTDAVTAFDVLDDLSVAGMHMTKSSMAMMGGKMDIQFLSSNKTGINTKYRWTGKVLWMPLDFTVIVSEWKRGMLKAWETIGPAKLIIYSWFRMNLQVHQIGELSNVNLSISYLKPHSLFGRILCYLLGDWYAKWCIDNMLRDAAKRIDSINKQSVPA